VIRATGASVREAKGAIRLSLGKHTTAEELESAVRQFRDAVV